MTTGTKILNLAFIVGGLGIAVFTSWSVFFLYPYGFKLTLL